MKRITQHISMKKHPETKKHEAGNVLFFILLAAGLFAALSYTVSRSNRGSPNIDRSQARVIANDIVSYGGTIVSAIEQIRQEGFSENQISFAHPQLDATYGTFDDNPTTEVFNVRGGAVTFSNPAGTRSAGDLIFSATNDVRNVGSRCVDGSCSNCTSIASTACVDLIMFLPLNDPNTCRGINEILNVGDDVNNQTTLDGTFDETLFDGTFSYQDSIESTGVDNVFNGKRGGCFEGTGSQAGTYYYYNVLIAR